MEKRGVMGDGGAPRAEIAQGDGCEVYNHAAGRGNRRDEVQTEIDAEEQVHDQIAARNSVSVGGFIKPAARTRQRAATYLRVQGSEKSEALSSSLPPPKPMMMRAGRKKKV